jgi:hypothetical protein
MYRYVGIHPVRSGHSEMPANWHLKPRETRREAVWRVARKEMGETTLARRKSRWGVNRLL